MQTEWLDMFILVLFPFFPLYRFVKGKKTKIDVWCRMLSNLYFQELQRRREGALVSYRFQALMGCLVSLNLEVAAFDRLMEGLCSNCVLLRVRNDVARVAGYNLMSSARKASSASLPLPHGRLKVGTMVLFGSNFKRGIVVGGDGSNVILCVEFEESEKVVSALDVVAVDGPHHPLDHCTSVGKYFLRFDLEKQCYIPNQALLAEFPDDFGPL